MSTKIYYILIFVFTVCIFYGLRRISQTQEAMEMELSVLRSDKAFMLSQIEETSRQFQRVRQDNNTIQTQLGNIELQVKYLADSLVLVNKIQDFQVSSQTITE